MGLAGFDADNVLHLALPAKDKIRYTIAAIDVRKSAVMQNTPGPDGFECTAMRGGFALLRTHETSPWLAGINTATKPDEWQVRDNAGNLVWSRQFKPGTMPGAALQDGRLLLLWSNPKEEIGNLPELRER